MYTAVFCEWTFSKIRQKFHNNPHDHTQFLLFWGALTKSNEDFKRQFVQKESHFFISNRTNNKHSPSFVLIAKADKYEAESVANSSEEEWTLLCGRSKSTAIEKQYKQYLKNNLQSRKSRYSHAPKAFFHCKVCLINEALNNRPEGEDWNHLSHKFFAIVSSVENKSRRVKTLF